MLEVLKRLSEGISLVDFYPSVEVNTRVPAKTNGIQPRRPGNSQVWISLASGFRGKAGFPAARRANLSAEFKRESWKRGATAESFRHAARRIEFKGRLEFRLEFFLARSPESGAFPPPDRITRLNFAPKILSVTPPLPFSRIVSAI